MKELFDETSFKISKLVTNAYSTSFSLGIKLLASHLRPEICSVYGFVRYADEIVDSFHDYNQEELILEFETDYKKALDRKISLNPVLNSFQKVVHEFKLYELVESFMHSMKLDLEKSDYMTEEEYKAYIYGSADVVGLMCLKIFVRGDEEKYESLKGEAMNLGSAFQKVNFLRDIKDDFERLGRSYFPNMSGNEFNNQTKKEIIEDINKDFLKAYEGILKLPMDCKLGVYVAYRYYCGLLKKIKRKNSQDILENRIRLSNPLKIVILFKSYIRYQLNMI